jgi:hypothetical protein
MNCSRLRLLVGAVCLSVVSCSRPGVVVVEAPPGGSTKPMMPFAFEHQADVIVFGHMGEPFKADGQDVVRLHIDKVLKGPVAGSGIDVTDALPEFGCIPPEDPRTASALFAEGTPVVAYLDDVGSFWMLLSLTRLEPTLAEHIERRIVRFAEIESAASARDAAGRYGELLVPEQGGLDEPAYWALMHTPDRAAIPALMRLLERTVEATERGPGVAETAVTRLTHTLVMLNEPRAVEQLALAFPRIDRGTRMRLYPHLARLAGDDKTQQGHVRALLLAELSTPALAASPFQYQTVTSTLGDVADRDAVTRLLAEQTRHADDALGQYLPTALSKAAVNADAEDLSRIVESWVRIVESMETPAQPANPQTAFARQVMRALGSVKIDPERRARLERVLAEDPGGWYARDLTAVLE